MMSQCPSCCNPRNSRAKRLMSLAGRGSFRSSSIATPSSGPSNEKQRVSAERKPESRAVVVERKDTCGRRFGAHRRHAAKPGWPNVRRHPPRKRRKYQLSLVGASDVRHAYNIVTRVLLRPVAGIDVPSDRNDRRNPLESGDNVRRTDVADVDNMRHACEALLDLRTQEPVSVRDDFNSKHCATIPRCPTVWTRTPGRSG
jgi:hypothetical protein